VRDELLGVFSDLALEVKKVVAEMGHCTHRHSLSEVAWRHSVSAEC